MEKNEDALVMNAVTVASKAAADFDRVFLLHSPDVHNRVEWSLYATSGRLLDTRDFGNADLGSVPAGLLAAVNEIVSVNHQPPGSE
ncbi:MAG: hypothetical protein ABSC06_01650 [Rhodopila sp.]